MNFQITRIRLTSVGPEPARYDPLELDLRRPDQTGPAETVLFLPNTGGKTVLMRLLFSVLHPPIVERIGTEETSHQKKNLLGYVLDRDTAHVAIEWRRVEDGRFADDGVLVTGLVAEWREHRRPSDPKPDDLRRLWYSVRGPVGTVGIDQLVFETDAVQESGSVRRRLPLRRFQEQLEEFRKAGGARNKVEVATTSVQRDWVDHLDRLGLDRALFRYQGEMNHNEAGASAIARFREDRDFIKFFLDAVFDPGELASLDREFEEVADKVRRLPEYERRLLFEQAALRELEPLAGLVTVLMSARAEAQSAGKAALTLLGAFAAGEAVCRARESGERRRAHEQDQERSRLVAAADRFRDEWREFRRLGANFWKRETERTLQESIKRTAQAELDVRGWSLTEDFARLATAKANLAAINAAYEEEIERLRPLQATRDEAAMRLARHLVAQTVIAVSNEANARRRADSCKQRAAAARQEATEALIEAERLDTERKAAQARVDEVAALRARLVGKELLALDEPAEDAVARETSIAEGALARIETIRREIDAFGLERRNLDEQDRSAAPVLAEISAQHSRIVGEVDRAQSERRALSADPLVMELAEAPEFDLELVGAGITERLLGRARETDDARLALELQGIDDRRAVRGLEESGLLPPPPEVATALARLQDAGIASAVAGTRYIADAVARSRWDLVVSRRADLVGGIVLTDPTEVDRARMVLDSASLEPTMIIAVGAALDLAAAEQATTHSEAFVVPPSEAVWDRTAASAERARRETRLAALGEQQTELDQRAAGARMLAERLVRHATAYPTGWLAAHVAQRDALARELGRLNDERTAREVRKNEIATALDALHSESTKRHRLVREAEQRRAELQRLQEDEKSIAGWATTIERQRAEAQNWRGLAEDSARVADDSSKEADRENAAAHDHHATADRIRREQSSIRLSAEISTPALDEAQRIAAEGGDLFDLRAHFAELDRRLTGESSSLEIAAKRSVAIEARDELLRVISTHPADTQQRAAELLKSPEAGDLIGRRAAAERSSAAASDARAAEQVAHTDDGKAKDELKTVEEEIQSSRRRVDIPVARTPRDRQHAALLAADARQNADGTQIQIASLERERNVARENADSAKKLADALSVLATPLRMGLKLSDDSALPAVEPFVGDIEQANATGLATAQRLTAAVDAQHAAEKSCQERDSAVRAVLTNEDFADLAASDKLYRRLAQSSSEALARDAEELVAELRATIRVLQDELATLDQDRRLATTSLAKSVNKALSYLRLAETRSKLPPRLRDWSGESFIEIRFEKPPAEELDVRLRTFVVQILDPKSDRPTGSKLLMLALDRAVGEFRVKILKPNEAFAPIRVPVAELSSPTFSNGQRATVATALMLMLSELRRQSRSSARDASVGTLLLDNPLGNANAGFLIDVQRTVAAAAGIQLIYTTGIADFNALRRFQNVIALSNDGARRTMRRYVRANPELLQLLVPADDGNSGRISAQRVVAVTDHEASGH